MMKKAPFADIIDALVTECPYCGESAILQGSSLGDLSGSDFEMTGIVSCEWCLEEFEYQVDQ